MEEGAKEERVEKAAAEANGPDEEVENKKKEGAEKAKKEGKKRSDEREKKAEGAGKQQEAKEKTDDEKGPGAAKEEVGEKDTGSPKSQPDEKKQREAKEQKDKEPAKKPPISSFFGEQEFASEMCLNCFYQLENTAQYFLLSTPSLTFSSFHSFHIYIYLFCRSSQESSGENRQNWDKRRREKNKPRQEELGGRV